MSFLQKISKYIIIVVVGVCLAFFVAWIQYDGTDLSASVLSLTEQDFFESTSRDAWYKTIDQNFELFLAEKVRYDWELTISIIYSPSNFERFTDKITWNCITNIISQTTWNLILTTDQYEMLDFSEWVFQIPFSWDAKDVTLEYVKSQKHDFAIWSLNNIEETIH